MEVIMNKIKLISLSLVVALVLMGTAFAWWEQSTTISNKVTTGELDVQLKNIGDPTIYFTNPKAANMGLDINKHYNAKVANYNFKDKYTLDVEINNVFPGSYVAYAYGVDNIGTVPIKIKDVKLITGEANTLPTKLLDDLPISFCFRVQKKDNTMSPQYRVDGNYKNIEGLIKKALSTVILVPGDRLVINNLDKYDINGKFQSGLIITFPEEWKNDTENCTIAFSLKFDYIQANAISN
jgi:predicted ribosomally synthesized peptide with SipW-like signal peptide